VSAACASLYYVAGRAVELGPPEFDPSLAPREYVARLGSLGIRTVLVGEPAAAHPTLRPVAGCLRPVAVYHARFVPSRSLGRSEPLPLVLYSAEPCLA